MVEKRDTDEEFEVVEGDETHSDDSEIEVEEEESSLTDKIKALREKLATCEDEKRKHLEDLQRGRADFLNSKRRLDEQLARDKERATDKILSELLTLVDSFDTAMMDAALWESIDTRWRTGVEAIHTKLLAILKSNNVIPTDPIGQKFNPEEHEAVSNVPVTEDAEVDTIVAVLQKGFKRNESMIRPAKVVVGTK